jgi:hypothetical protein
MATGFTIELAALDHNLNRFDERVRKGIDKTMTYQAARSETYMKSNARWTDRTTNARNALFVSVTRHSEDSWEMILSHGVSYGIWLEVSNGGKYAIVRPTFLRAGKQTMQLLSRLFERMEK